MEGGGWVRLVGQFSLMEGGWGSLELRVGGAGGPV